MENDNSPNNSGVVHVLVLMILLVGIVAGVWAVQYARTVLQSKAVAIACGQVTQKTTCGQPSYDTCTPSCDSTGRAKYDCYASQNQNCRGTIYCQPEDNRCFGISCPQVDTFAKNLSTGECKKFLAPCDIPAEWLVVTNCNSSSDTIPAPSQQDRQLYQIKPVILIPASFKKRISNNQIQQYKTDIFNALEEVQAWYASKLAGRTFQVDNVDLMVVTQDSSTTAIEGDYASGINYLYDYLDKANLARDIKNKDLVVWHIGNFSNIGLGYLRFTKDEGGNILDLRAYVSLSQRNLEMLGDKQNINLKNLALGMLAHELGHSFGLVHAGWAKGHPCSVISVENCKTGAPTPLPSAEAWTMDLMGYEFPAFPNVGLNDSIHNPEVWKIYQSPFINPKNDPVPPGTIIP